MNSNEKKYLQLLYKEVNMKGNFNTIKDRIQIQEVSKPIKNLHSLILKILMPCELLATCICLGLFLLYFIVNKLRGIPEGQEGSRIEITYLILTIVFSFIFIVTIAFYQRIKSKKEGKHNEI